jgi:hypothetical protein
VPNGIRAEHDHGLDRKLAQRANPVAEDAVQANAVKVNRHSHQIVGSLAAQAVTISSIP